MRKKLISMLLTLCMVLSLLPMAAFAEGDESAAPETDTYTVEDDAAVVNEEGSEDLEDQSDSSEEDVAAIDAPAVGEGHEALPSASNDQIKLEAGKYYELTGDVSNVNFLGLWGDDSSTDETTLDLKGHTITGKGEGYVAIYLATGSLNIVNTGSTQGKIVGTQYTSGPLGAINVTGNAQKLTIGENVLVEGANGEYCIVFESGLTSQVQLKLDGCELKVENGNAIGVNGLIGTGSGADANVAISLEGAKIEAGGVGIYQAGAAATSDVTINRSTVKGGETGIEIRSGSLTLKNSTVTGGSGGVEVVANGNGPTTKNAAVSVARHTTNKEITVTLNDGVTLEGGAALSVANPQNTTAKVQVDINGGTYTGAVQVQRGSNAEGEDTTVTIKGGVFSANPFDEGTGVTAPGGYGTYQKDGKYIVGKQSNVTVGTIQNGSVSVEPRTAIEGQTVTVTATPGFACTLETLSVGGQAVSPLPALKDGVYTHTFAMPAQDVAVTASFKSPSHKITTVALPTAGGKVTASLAEAKAGDEVSITAEAAGDYDFSGFQVYYTSTGGDKIFVSVTGGKFTMPNTAVTIEAAFTLKEPVIESKVETTVAAPGTVQIPSDAKIEAEDQEAVKQAAQASKMDAAQAAHDAADEIAKAETAESKQYVQDALKALGVDKADDVEIIVKPVLEITPTAYDVSDDTKPVLTLDIKGTLKVFAQTKGNTDDGNRKPLKDKDITQPVEITVKLPFSVGEGNAAFVGHKKKYQYPTTTNGGDVYTFINPHGFSEFVIRIEDNTVVSSDQHDYTYLNFEAAAEEAKAGDTLTICKDNGAHVTLPTGVKVKLSSDAVKFTGTINGKSVNLTTSEYSVPSTISSSNTGGGGGGGGSSKPSIKPGAQTKPDAPTGGVAGFRDVAASAWYAEYVQYVVDKGLFGGVGNGNFAPEANMTRAMMWTVLARYMGVNTDTGSNWYEAARAWAIEKGISDGTMADGNVTREQFVTMLWRLSGEPAADSAADFTDGGKVSDYAKTAVAWAVSQGIVNGYSDGSFKPQGSATRAEVAKMLTVFCQSAEADA